MYLLSSRFTNETFEQNISYRLKHKDFICIYCSPCKISNKIPINSQLIIIEMNNNKNKIEGIGIIRNVIRYDKRRKIYEKDNYNRYIYIGKYRLNRDEISNNIIEFFDTILFKGKSHSKRGSGITLLSDKLLTRFLNPPEPLPLLSSLHTFKKNTLLSSIINDFCLKYPTNKKFQTYSSLLLSHVRDDCNFGDKVTDVKDNDIGNN
jgi:hypothetical protein